MVGGYVNAAPADRVPRHGFQPPTTRPIRKRRLNRCRSRPSRVSLGTDPKHFEPAKGPALMLGWCRTPRPEPVFQPRQGQAKIGAYQCNFSFLKLEYLKLNGPCC